MMKRLIAVLASATFVLAIGCSDYDIRLEKTLEERRYAKTLNENLEPAPTKGALQADDIFIRPPKGLVGPNKTFALTVVETGKFDIENSFIDEKNGTSLHVLARVKKPKAATAKKAEAAAEAPAPRGKFLDDVTDLVKAAYNIELAPGEFKPESFGHGNRDNAYKIRRLEVGMKQVEIYVYTESSGVHEVALIFEYPNKQDKEKDKTDYMSPKIRHCLESLAVSDRARSSFNGVTDLDAGEVISPGAPPPI
jgi:hypothetical protein